MPEGNDADRLDYPFVGIPSFLRSPIVADLARLNADVAVLGVPTDEGSPFMPGSRFAPRSIRALRFGFDLVEVNPMLDVRTGWLRLPVVRTRANRGARGVAAGAFPGREGRHPG